MAEYEEQPGNYPRLTYDPRTNLPLIDLPYEYEDSFGILKNTIMHWFGPVVAYSGRMRPTNRVLIISDSAIYLAQTETTMQRCWKIKSIDTLYVDEENPSWVIMKVAPPARGNAGTSLVKDPDLIADVGTPDARDAIMDIIDAVYSYLTGRNVLRLAVPPGSRPEEIVDTSKMPGWTKTLEMLHSRASLEQFYAQPQTDPRIEQAKAVAQNEFEKMKQQLKVTMSGYRAQDFEAKTREIDMYIDMLDDRDREIQRLKQLRDTIYEDANVWARCPNCKVRQLEASANTTTKTIHSLQRQIEDAEHLLDHLQHSRAASKAVAKKGSTSVLDHHQVSESTQLIHLRQKKHELSERIIELRNIIVENPVSYPTQEARKDASGRERDLEQKVYDLDRTLAEKDKELRLTKSIMREAFQKQVDELEKLKGDFGRYDGEVVTYLEKVFAEKAFPRGAHDNQTPRELATVTAEAARQAATPVRIPDLPSEDDMRFVHHATADPYLAQDLEERSPTRAWLGSHLEPLSKRLAPSVASGLSRKSAL